MLDTVGGEIWQYKSSWRGDACCLYLPGVDWAPPLGSLQHVGYWLNSIRGITIIAPGTVDEGR